MIFFLNLKKRISFFGSCLVRSAGRAKSRGKIDKRNERTETSQRKRDLAKTLENSLTFEFTALRNGISPARVTLRDTP